MMYYVDLLKGDFRICVLRSFLVLMRDMRAFRHVMCSVHGCGDSLRLSKVNWPSCSVIGAACRSACVKEFDDADTCGMGAEQMMTRKHEDDNGTAAGCATSSPLRATMKGRMVTMATSWRA